MPAYKLTVGGESCKAVGEVEEYIVSLNRAEYGNIQKALSLSQGGSPSYLGDFEEEDFEHLSELSTLYPNIALRLAVCYYEYDPENVDVFLYKKGEDVGL